MAMIDFKQSPADSMTHVCSFEVMKISIAVVTVYVDDLIIITKTTEEMISMKENLTARFKMKHLGKLDYYLGIIIKQDERNKCL